MFRCPSFRPYPALLWTIPPQPSGIDDMTRTQRDWPHQYPPAWQKWPLTECYSAVTMVGIASGGDLTPDQYEILFGDSRPGNAFPQRSASADSYLPPAGDILAGELPDFLSQPPAPADPRPEGVRPTLRFVAESSPSGSGNESSEGVRPTLGFVAESSPSGPANEPSEGVRPTLRFNTEPQPAAPADKPPLRRKKRRS